MNAPLEAPDQHRYCVVVSYLRRTCERETLEEQEFSSEDEARTRAADVVSELVQQFGSGWDFRGDLWRIPAEIPTGKTGEPEMKDLANVTWNASTQALVWADGVPDWDDEADAAPEGAY
ncbi:hypothetical protein ACWDSJ_28350 [Nocardia sp. NPDC003482]